MKKNTYLGIITAITVVLIIVGVSWNIAPAMGFSLPWQKTDRSSGKDKMVTRTWQEGELGECRSVALSLDAADIVLETGDHCEIRFEGNEKLMPEVKVDNGHWTVMQRNKKINYIKLHDLYKNNRLVLTVPADVQAESVNVEADAGDLDIRGIRALELIIDADAGDIDLEGIEVQSMTMNVDAGDIDIVDSTVTNGSVDTNMGDLKIANTAFTDFSVELDAGDAVIESPVPLDDADLNLDVDLGEIKVNGADESNQYRKQGSSGIRLSVTADLGDIRLSW